MPTFPAQHAQDRYLIYWAICLRKWQLWQGVGSHCKYLSSC
jgi:hypothetical protein